MLARPERPHCCPAKLVAVQSNQPAVLSISLLDVCPDCPTLSYMMVRKSSGASQLAFLQDSRTPCQNRPAKSSASGSWSMVACIAITTNDKSGSCRAMAKDRSRFMPPLLQLITLRRPVDRRETDAGAGCRELDHQTTGRGMKNNETPVLKTDTTLTSRSLDKVTAFAEPKLAAKTSATTSGTESQVFSRSKLPGRATSLLQIRHLNCMLL